MELIEFLEKFLPDCGTKIEKEVANAPAFWDEDARRLWAYYELFPEALQNFAGRVCEKQRENCADAYFRQDYGNSLHDERLSGEGNEDIFLDSEQPKIEEL
jgi:hypothetical protein